MKPDAADNHHEPFVIILRSMPEQIVEILRANNLFSGHDRLPSSGTVEFMKNQSQKQIPAYAWVESVIDDGTLELISVLASITTVAMLAVVSIPLYFGIPYADTVYRITLIGTSLALFLALLRFGCLPQTDEVTGEGPFESDYWNQHIPATETAAWQKVLAKLQRLEQIRSCRLTIIMHTRSRFYGFIRTKQIKVGAIYAFMTVTGPKGEEYKDIVLRAWSS
jgi:hypothetical protein